MLQGIKKVFRLSKILFLIIAVYVTIISIFSFAIKREKQVPKGGFVADNRKAIYDRLKDPKLTSTKEGRIYLSLFRFATCNIAGEACTSNPADQTKYFPSSLLGRASDLLAAPLTNPPASGITWTLDSFAKAGFVPSIYAAQGIGFSSVRPLMNIWVILRDVAYMILVLVIITIGFMIMFRMKLNPQTVISVENALPKIVLSLIYITFSFAIAGFLIDFMYIVIAIIISLLGPQAKMDVTATQNMILTADPSKIFVILSKGNNGFFNFGNIFWELPNALLQIVPMIHTLTYAIGSLLGAWLLLPIVIQMPSWFGINDVDLVGALTPAGLGVTLEGVVKFLIKSGLFIILTPLVLLIGAIGLFPLIVGLLLFLTLLLLFFRIFFMIFSSYIKLMLLIIVSPLYLMLEAIPGQSTFTSWIRSILNELVVFPVIVSIFMISIIVVDNAASGNILQLPFLVVTDSKSLSIIIGMWFLFMVPDLVSLVQKQLNPKPLPLDADIGAFFGGASTGISTGLGEMSKYAMLSTQFAPLGRLMALIPGFKPPGGKGK